MPCVQFYKCCIESDALFELSEDKSRFIRIADVPKSTVIMGKPVYVKPSAINSAIFNRTSASKPMRPTDSVTWPYTCLRVVMMCIYTKTQKIGYVVCRPHEWKRYWPKNLQFRQYHYKNAYYGSVCYISKYFIRVKNMLRVGCIDAMLQVGFLDDARILQKFSYSLQNLNSKNSKKFENTACSSKPVTFPLFKIRKSNDTYIATHLLDKSNPHVFQQNEVEGAEALHQLQQQPVHCRLV